jgi:hypothetical protein
MFRHLIDFCRTLGFGGFLDDAKKSGGKEEGSCQIPPRTGTRGRSERKPVVTCGTTNGSERLRRRIGSGRKAEAETGISSVGQTTGS